ncbi:MAG: hypothetical protein UX16_C0018G0006 [Parcubacteria group bacterium GW2011_GWB1_45_7]|nr:MAG: hypothetical protein UX16_C0018G0006 [Parcubacteria group bacterium GW2011_GWB1_45_7]
MSKAILDTIFGSRVRVKILKLLYRQYPASFGLAELSARIQEPSFIARRELALLQVVGLVKKIRVAKTIEQYGLNSSSDLFAELRELVLKPLPAEIVRLSKRIDSLGRIQLAIVAGIFVSRPEERTYEAPADLFIVGDMIDKKKLNLFLKSLEADMGAEIRFAVMDPDEFRHRYEYFDRFLRVLLEGPHQKLINKME